MLRLRGEAGEGGEDASGAESEDEASAEQAEERIRAQTASQVSDAAAREPPTPPAHGGSGPGLLAVKRKWPLGHVNPRVPARTPNSRSTSCSPRSGCQGAALCRTWAAGPGPGPAGGAGGQGQRGACTAAGDVTAVKQEAPASPPPGGPSLCLGYGGPWSALPPGTLQGTQGPSRPRTRVLEGETDSVPTRSPGTQDAGARPRTPPGGGNTGAAVRPGLIPGAGAKPGGSENGIGGLGQECVA